MLEVGQGFGVLEQFAGDPVIRLHLGREALGIRVVVAVSSPAGSLAVFSRWRGHLWCTAHVLRQHVRSTDVQVVQEQAPNKHAPTRIMLTEQGGGQEFDG